MPYNKIIAPNGEEFNNITELCETYNIKPKHFNAANTYFEKCCKIEQHPSVLTKLRLKFAKIKFKIQMAL